MVRRLMLAQVRIVFRCAPPSMEVNGMPSACPRRSIAAAIEAEENAASDDYGYGDLDDEKTKKLVSDLADVNVTVLELAATIHWLWHRESHLDWEKEIIKRKT
jgi:hypothetical protein